MKRNRWGETKGEATDCVCTRLLKIQVLATLTVKWGRGGDGTEGTQVPPRWELGPLDSESRVLTITPWWGDQLLPCPPLHLHRVGVGGAEKGGLVAEGSLMH